MDLLSQGLAALGDILFHDVVLFILVASGIVFTLWSGFSQYRALTHGVSVIRGRWDEKGDPGAINHFQALSAALSATVGLGNIAGVAVAVALGGPGAIFWMWIIGLVGMALKLTEVSMAMLYRNTDDPDNPQGGPMWVARRGLQRRGAVRQRYLRRVDAREEREGPGNSPKRVPSYSPLRLSAALLGPLGTFVGGVFCVTVIISAITGGNMFQAWNVGDVTFTYLGVPPIACGIVLAIIVGTVIIGGIKRIGAVAGRLVPAMCLLYLLAALYVLVVHITDIPAMLGLIVQGGLPTWLGGSAIDPHNAFLGGTFGYAAMWGIKRALFSSEAGQGSAPIAHAAAKTNEPIREGVVAGLEPFIDTIVVCTLTALVIMASGAWDRPPEAHFPADAEVVIVPGEVPDQWTLETPSLPRKTAEARRILRQLEGSGWRIGETVFMIVRAEENPSTGRDHRRLTGQVQFDADREEWAVDWYAIHSAVPPRFLQQPDGTPDHGIYGDYAGASLTAHAFDRVAPGLGMWLVVLASWLFAISTMITWSYYGEQGVVYLVGPRGVLPYKLAYCALIAVATLGFIRTDEQLDRWTMIGTGVMLWVNIPIMWIFGAQTMRAYHDYIRRLRSGQMRPPHASVPLQDLVEGK